MCIWSIQVKFQLKRKTWPSKAQPTLAPDLLSEIKEMRSDMALLKDLRAEVAQIRETIQKSTPAPHSIPNQAVN